MEATGYYHYRLVQFVYKNNVAESVVNLLSVKRFIQMKLAKVKTDKSGAKAICEYAIANKVLLYNALTDVQAVFTTISFNGQLPYDPEFVSVLAVK